MENNTSKKTSDNVLTALDKSRYCTLKTQHGCNISQPAYVVDDNGTLKRDADGRKIPLFKMVTDKNGDEKRERVNEFSEDVNFTLDWGNVTFGDLIDKFASNTAIIRIQSRRKHGHDAVKSINGMTIDAFELITNNAGTGALTKGIGAIDTLTKNNDVDALTSMQNAIMEKIAFLKQS